MNLREWKARRRGEIFDKYDYATRYEIELARPPGLADLTAEEYREVIRAQVREVEEEAAAKRGDRLVVGAAGILAQNPLEPLPTPHADRPKKSPAPRLFFAFSSDVGAALERAYDELVQRHRFASSLLRVTAMHGGDPGLAKGFPQGSFPPGYPFIGAPPLVCPPRPPTRRLEYLDNGECRRGPVPVIRISGRGLERSTQRGDASPTGSSSSPVRGPWERGKQLWSRDPPS